MFKSALACSRYLLRKFHHISHYYWRVRSGILIKQYTVTANIYLAHGQKVIKNISKKEKSRCNHTEIFYLIHQIFFLFIFEFSIKPSANVIISPKPETAKYVISSPVFEVESDGESSEFFSSC